MKLPVGTGLLGCVQHHCAHRWVTRRQRVAVGVPRQSQLRVASRRRSLAARNSGVSLAALNCGAGQVLALPDKVVAACWIHLILPRSVSSLGPLEKKESETSSRVIDVGSHIIRTYLHVHAAASGSLWHSIDNKKQQTKASHRQQHTGHSSIANGHCTALLAVPQQQASKQKYQAEEPGRTDRTKTSASARLSFCSPAERAR